MQVKRVTPAGQAHAAGIVGGAQHFIWSGEYSSGAAARPPALPAAREGSAVAEYSPAVPAGLQGSAGN